MDESVEARPSVLDNPLDIEQLRLKAQNWWLSQPEICEIIRNYKKFGTTSEPPNKPPSGSLFLFDKKVKSYIGNDGHNWTKKKDGKTLLEGHRKLKDGSFDGLNCYYAHGEENRNFQRRRYWMLKGDFSHIVFVHYLEVTGKTKDSSCVRETQGAGPSSQETKDAMPNSEIDGSIHSSSHLNNCQVTENTDTTRLNCAQALEPESVQSVDIEYNHQPSSGLHSSLELGWPAAENIDAGGPDPNDPLYSPNSFCENLSAFPCIDLSPTQLDKGKSDNDAELAHDPLANLCSMSWEDILATCTDSSGKPFSNSVVGGLDNGDLQIQIESKTSFEDFSSFSKWPMYQKLYSESACEHDHVLPPDSDDHLNLKYEEGLKKLDSLNHWNDKELGDVKDVDESHMLPGSGALWGTVENENGIEIGVSSIPSEGQVQTFMPGPSMSQDQLFSIIDFSPNWAYVGSETKVLIVGRLMKSPHVLENSKWSCMFGKVEVPAEVIADGVLCCRTPTHEASRVPFYIMSSNGLACSEILEFEFQTVQIEDINTAENYNGSANDNLQSRFDKLLSLSSRLTTLDPSSWVYISQLSSKISSLLKGDYKELDQMLTTGSGTEFSVEKFKDQLPQKHLKEKLHVWILEKVAEGGDGPSILDEGGQGVLHFAAALGYDWALEPTIVAGVSVDFRDVNGWTALHWAAFCGREQAVASLISLGAAPRALTDRSPKYPSGRTPTDLASVNGHKGIAAYLAGRSSDVHIPSINLDHQDGAAGPKPVQKNSEISAAPLSLGNASDCQSQEDLSATSFRSLEHRWVIPKPPAQIFEPTSSALGKPAEETQEALKFQTHVLKVPIHCEGGCCKKVKKVLRGIDGVSMTAIDFQQQKVTVTGNVDAETLIRRLRAKLGKRAEIWPEKAGKPKDDEGPDDEGPDDEGPDDDGSDDEGPDDEPPEKDKEPEKKEGKKRGPDPALGSGKADKILKAYSAFMALLTAYYNVQRMETIQMLVLVCAEASKKTGERKLSYIDDGFGPSAIRV